MNKRRIERAKERAAAAALLLAAAILLGTVGHMEYDDQQLARCAESHNLP